MSPPPPSAGLHGPPLVGLLAQLALVERATVPPSFVEGMGRWLGWKQAIPLSAVLLAPPAAALRPASPMHPSAGAEPLAAEFSRVQDALALAITDDAAMASEDGGDFVPWRRRYTALQHAMEAALTPLRARLRDAVAQLSPELARLAALDAVLANALAAHEQAQLAQMPALLGKHFTRLRPAHAEPAPQADWLQTFRQDMQRLLLAELALRLQPAQGLLDTLQGTHD